MYQGWNDYLLRPQRALKYREEVIAANGGERSTRNFFGLYMVPGMYADLVLFDPDLIQDHASIESPGALSTGIDASGSMESW